MNPEIDSNKREIYIYSSVPGHIIIEGEIYRKTDEIQQHSPLLRLYDKETLVSGHYLSSVYPFLCIYHDSFNDSNLVIGRSEANSHTLEPAVKESVNVENYRIGIEDYHLMLLTESHLTMKLEFLVNGYIHRNLGDSWSIKNFDDGFTNNEVSSDINSKQSFIKFNIKLQKRNNPESEMPEDEVRQIIKESLNTYETLNEIYLNGVEGSSKIEFVWILRQFIADTTNYDKLLTSSEEVTSLFKSRMNSYIDLYRAKKGIKDKNYAESESSKSNFKPLVPDASGNLRLAENDLILALTKEELESISEIMEILKKYPDLVIGKYNPQKANDSSMRFSRGKFKFLLEGEDLKCSYDDFKSETQSNEKLREMLPVLREMLNKLPPHFFICYGGFNFRIIEVNNEPRMCFNTEITENDPKPTVDQIGRWAKIKNY